MSNDFSLLMCKKTRSNTEGSHQILTISCDMITNAVKQGQRTVKKRQHLP